MYFQLTSVALDPTDNTRSNCITLGNPEAANLKIGLEEESRVKYILLLYINITYLF